MGRVVRISYSMLTLGVDGPRDKVTRGSHTPVCADLNVRDRERLLQVRFFHGHLRLPAGVSNGNARLVWEHFIKFPYVSRMLLHEKMT